MNNNNWKIFKRKNSKNLKSEFTTFMIKLKFTIYYNNCSFLTKTNDNLVYKYYIIYNLKT